MTKKQRALEIIERLKKEYPDAGCTLDYDQAWKLLVSVRLAAQCTDALGGRDRGNRKALRLRSQQGERYQRLHENP